MEPGLLAGRTPACEHALMSNQIGAGRRARRLRELAAASRAYLPMPEGHAPLSGPLEVVDRFFGAFEAHDHKAIGELFAEDADYINVVGLWWTSRRSIERVFKRQFKREYAAATIAPAKLSFRQVGSDAAVLHVRWTLTGQVDPEGESADERQGILSITMERAADSTWLIVSMQNTDIVVASDTNVAHGGKLEAASYVPEVPDEPGADAVR